MRRRDMFKCCLSLIYLLAEKSVRLGRELLLAFR